MKSGELTPEEDLAYRHLSGRAFASLDEHGETELVKKRQAVEKRLAKLGIEECETRRPAVKRFLLLLSDCETSYRQAAKKVGMSLPDLHAEFAMWPEGAMVRDYMLEVKRELTRLDDMEDLKRARAAMRETVEDEGSRDRAKAAMFMMSKLDRKQFGEEPRGGGAGDGSGRAQVVYNLPGLTLNMINAPKDMTLRLEKALERPAINI